MAVIDRAVLGLYLQSPSAHVAWWSAAAVPVRWWLLLLLRALLTLTDGPWNTRECRLAVDASTGHIVMLMRRLGKTVPSLRLHDSSDSDTQHTRQRR